MKKETVKKQAYYHPKLNVVVFDKSILPDIHEGEWLETVFLKKKIAAVSEKPPLYTENKLKSTSDTKYSIDIAHTPSQKELEDFWRGY